MSDAVAAEDQVPPEVAVSTPTRSGHQVTDRARYARINRDELRAQAASMWVDMEEGITEGVASGAAAGGPSKNLIARNLGFEGTRTYMPAFLAEPEFGRAVEFERVRRVTQGSSQMTKREIGVLSSMIARAGLLEAARRFVLEPQKLRTRELLPETRNYARLAADVADTSGGGEGRGVHQTINVFFQAAERLPPRAREKFLGIFEQSMDRMALAAGEARRKAETKR